MGRVGHPRPTVALGSCGRPKTTADERRERGVLALMTGMHSLRGMCCVGRTGMPRASRLQLITPRLHGYSAWSYEMALRDGLLPQYDGTRRFQQDNASIHTARRILSWLYDHDIELLE